MSRGQHAQPPLRLTRRGRIVRDMVAGAGILGFAVLAQPISEAYFTFVLWFGQVTGTTA